MTFAVSFQNGRELPEITAQNPSHTYSSAGTYTATLTVTDKSSPAKTATSSVTVTVSAVGNPLVATVGATPTSGQIPLNVAFTGTATLTVTDSSSPAKTASSSVTITASPIAGTAPCAPTGLTARAGTGQVSLSWTPPASNGGVNITSYRVYRGTASGTETRLTSGGCSGLGAVTSCTDTGLTNGHAYYYKVTAARTTRLRCRCSTPPAQCFPPCTPTPTSTKAAGTHSTASR